MLATSSSGLLAEGRELRVCGVLQAAAEVHLLVHLGLGVRELLLVLSRGLEAQTTQAVACPCEQL